MLLDIEVASEYTAELRQLKMQDDELEGVEKRVAKERTTIKTRIKDIAKVSGSETTRVVLPAGPYGAWDRQVHYRNAGLDLAALEELLGTDEFRRLCCVRQTHYIPSVEKIEAARLEGELTEATLAEAHTDGEAGYVLKKMTLKAFNKYKEEYDV